MKEYKLVVFPPVLILCLNAFNERIIFARAYEQILHRPTPSFSTTKIESENTESTLVSKGSLRQWAYKIGYNYNNFCCIVFYRNLSKIIYKRLN